jgi:DNA replication and repair protein RecF
MSLIELNINNLRNIVATSLTLHPRYNFIHGSNGSGKTSILEALYLVSHGRSFRSRYITPLINEHANTMSIFARFNDNASISIQKNSTGSTQVKLNQNPCLRCSELAEFLPCQLLDADIFQIIDAGSAFRREVLDWGMFHVKHSSLLQNDNYHALWINYRRILKQRNTLLRQHAAKNEFEVWDQQLSVLSEQLNVMRAEYHAQLAQVFDMFLKKLTNIECSLHYYKGWGKQDPDKSLANVLNEQFHSDQQRLYTQSGAHQADLIFKLPMLNAKQTLSRGQQKIILIALKFAQAYILNKPCMYLLDDLPAELDNKHVEKVMQSLELLPGQFFITTIDNNIANKWSQLYSANLFETNQLTVATS